MPKIKQIIEYFLSLHTKKEISLINESYSQFLHHCPYRPWEEYTGRPFIGIYEDDRRQRFAGSSAG
jgi:hypothetical protein